MMNRIILLFTMVTLSSVSPLSATAGECDPEEARTNISISVIRNTGGKWFSAFIAEKSIGDTTERVDLNLQYAIVKCGSDGIVRIKGILRDASAVYRNNGTILEATEYVLINSTSELPRRSDEKDILRFQEKKGEYAVLINDERTAYRNNSWNENGSAILVTNRPLKEEELFEVVVDKILAKWESGTFVIGVIVFPPATIESSKKSYFIKYETWKLWYDHVYRGGTIIKKNYGINLKSLKVGDRVGVQVRYNGDLHFFLNGNDMGLAASKVPTSVYGVLDVINYVEKIRIVD